MSIDYQPLLEDILKKLERFPYISDSDIPYIDLYMDQVTTFMEEQLHDTRRSPDDKILTKTMINNYAKNHLLPPPIRKKYSREHILMLVFIYYFKGFLSLQDIHSLAEPLNERFFRKEDALGIEEIYREAFRVRETQTQKIQEQVREIFDACRHGFSDLSRSVSEEEREFLQFYSMMISLGCDIYIKKSIMEQLIDAYNAQGRTDVRETGSRETSRKDSKETGKKKQ